MEGPARRVSQTTDDGAAAESEARRRQLRLPTKKEGASMCFRPAAISMEKTCPECGATNDFSNEVCDQCGATLPSAPPIAGMPGAPGVPGAPAAPSAPGAPGAPGALVRPEGPGSAGSAERQRKGRAQSRELVSRRGCTGPHQDRAVGAPFAGRKEAEMDLGARIAAMVEGTSYEDLPEEARTAAKMAVLDTLGVMLAGSGAGEDVGAVVGLLGRAGRKRGMQRGGVRQEEQPRAGRAGQRGACPQHRLR